MDVVAQHPNREKRLHLLLEELHVPYSFCVSSGMPAHASLIHQLNIKLKQGMSRKRSVTSLSTLFLGLELLLNLRIDDVQAAKTQEHRQT